MLLIEYNGEITPDLESDLIEIENQIKSLLIQNKDKVSNYCNYLDSMENEVNFCKDKIKEVEKYVSRIENSKEWLLKLAKTVIELNDLPLEGNFGNKIYLRKSVSTEITVDPMQLPVEFQKLEIKANVSEIRDALKSGLHIEGCRLVEKKNVNWK